MASTPFQVISWAPNDPITDEKLDAMVSNDGWLRDNMVMARYKSSGVTRDIGIKLAAGLVRIQAGKGIDRTPPTVSFDGFFSQGCQPIVTTGLVTPGQRQVFHTIKGPGNSVLPTRDGFTAQIHVVTAKNKPKRIIKTMFLSWHALGW
jgi:hypothetical protein